MSKPDADSNLLHFAIAALRTAHGGGSGIRRFIPDMVHVPAGRLHHRNVRQQGLARAPSAPLSSSSSSSPPTPTPQYSLRSMKPRPASTQGSPPPCRQQPRERRSHRERMSAQRAAWRSRRSPRAAAAGPAAVATATSRVGSATCRRDRRDSSRRPPGGGGRGTRLCYFFHCIGAPMLVRFSYYIQIINHCPDDRARA